jgi:hypothetical protein
MLSMLPNSGTEKLVSCLTSRQDLSALRHEMTFSGFDLGASLLRQLKCAHLVSAKEPLLEEVIFNQNQVAAEKRRTARKAQHKKRQIAKRDHNDNLNKRRKAGEQGVSSVRIRRPSRRGAAMSPARRSTGATCQGRPHRPRPMALKCRRRAGREAGRDKTVGSSSRPETPPTRVGQWSVRSRAAPSGTGTPGPQRPAPRQADLPRRSAERSVSVR